MNVTAADKCYSRRGWAWVFVCAGCDSLASSLRNDALTCSPACRVCAHRNGEIKRWQAVAREGGNRDPRTGKPQVAPMLQLQAVARLRPDLVMQIVDGSLTTYQVMPEVYRAFVKLLLRAAMA